MSWLNLIVEWGIPLLFTGVVAAFFIWLGLRFIPDEPRTRAFRQLAIVVVVLSANVLVVLVLPLDSETRGQLLSLFGLVVTAVIALASTSFVSNAMAGFMLRAVGSYHPGDFIQVAEHFGRVTESGLLHTEIQSVDRDLVTLPNLYVMNQAVKVLRSSGTLISADVSLGYDVHHNQVRDVLKLAAAATDLTDPYVQITGLADHAVSYRVLGFLEDVGNLVSKRTELMSRVLDSLHEAGIEIVSPGFVNQRRLDPERSFIPAAFASDTQEHTTIEKLMFDKAEVAGHLSELRHQRDELRTELEGLRAEGEASKAQLSWREKQIASLEGLIHSIESDH